MTLSPVVYLVVFCVVMSTLAIGRYLRRADGTRNDRGVILVVLGLTIVSFLWVGIDEEWIAFDVPVIYLGGILAAALIGIGFWWIGTTVPAVNSRAARC